MKCEDVRVLLAAYRRSDWTREEQTSAGEHLAGCAACRRWEAEARQVGERLRQLPTITPPASLRANVFAAVQAEQMAAAHRAAEAAGVGSTRTPTNPLPVVAVATASRPAERIGEFGLRRLRPPRILFGRVTAIGTVAALLGLLFLSHLMTFTIATPGSGIQTCLVCSSAPAQYSADPKFPVVTSVAANLSQVIYVGQGVASQGTAGTQMLFVRDRATGVETALLSAPSAQPLTIETLSSAYVVLLVGPPQGAWTLQAIPLTTDGQVPAFTQQVPTILATSGATLNGQHITTLTAVWASDTTVLAALALANGTTVLARCDLTAGAPPTVLTLAQSLPGHTLTDPYLDGATAYWTDVTTGSDGTLHSVLWRMSASGPQSLGVDFFRPVASGKNVVAFQPELTLPTTDATTGRPTLRIVGAIVLVHADGTVSKLSSGDTVSLANVWRGPGIILWRDDTGVHLYTVGTANLQNNSLLNKALVVGISPSEIAWATLPADAANTQSTIYVASAG